MEEFDKKVILTKQEDIKNADEKSSAKKNF